MYRINELLTAERRLFHTNDLAILWGMENRQTLYKTISRYLDKGILFKVFKGLYSTLPLKVLDPIEVGQAVIHRYTYLSTETILAQAGIITQLIYDWTFVTDISKKVEVGELNFRYRQMKDEFLFNNVGIRFTNGKRIASPERAVADLLYYNPRYHFDVPELIDFDLVRHIQEVVGYG